MRGRKHHLQTSNKLINQMKCAKKDIHTIEFEYRLNKHYQRFSLTCQYSSLLHHGGGCFWVFIYCFVLILLFCLERMLLESKDFRFFCYLSNIIACINNFHCLVKRNILFCSIKCHRAQMISHRLIRGFVCFSTLNGNSSKYAHFFCLNDQPPRTHITKNLRFSYFYYSKWKEKNWE